MFAHCLFVVFVLCCSTDNQGRIYVPWENKMFILSDKFLSPFRSPRNIEIPSCKNDSFFFLSAFGLLKNDYVKLTLSGFQDKRSNVSSLINVLPKLYVHIFYFLLTVIKLTALFNKSIIRFNN